MLRLNQKLQATGLSEPAAAAVCLDYDLAVAHFGDWVDRRLKATREVPVPKNQKQKSVKHVPRYPHLRAALGLMDDQTPARKHASKETTKAIDQKANELRRDPAALIDFLRLSGDA